MKNIIIITKKMELGGTEVSLLNTINELEKHDVKITLALLKKEGTLLNKIQKNVKIIEILNNEQNKYLEKFNINNNLKTIIKLFCMKIFKKISISKFYEYLLKKINTNDLDEYDLAIDYHGYGYFGTPYTIEKVKAKKKVMFVHDEKITWMKKVKKWMIKFDKIYCVSNACKLDVQSKFPKLSEKLDVYRNIIDKDKIIELSNEKIESLPKDKIKLLTIARLEYQKGYDMLIKVANNLDKDKYIWYIIGKGSLKTKIQEDIIKNNLENNVALLGEKTNPYPYLRQADIYVQTSRHEGYGIAIAEARCLNKPIVATRLKCISEQIKDGVTGLLCEFDEKDFFTKINNLINNKKLRDTLSSNLEKELFDEKNDILKLLED